MKSATVYRRIPDLDPQVEVKCSAAAAATHRKHLIYAGKFVKATDGTKQTIPVSTEMLDHWRDTGNLMLSKGIQIPLPVEHVTDPEKRRGSIVHLERGLDSKGRESLFGYISWRDPADAKTFAASDVSIYVPPEFIGTDETVYKMPIRHVALTDYPVIPDLDGMQVIAASFTASEVTMTFLDFAKAHSIELPENATEEDAQKAVEEAFKKAMEASKPTPPPTPPANPDEPKPQPVAAAFVSMARKARQSSIDALVTQRKITPAVAKELADQYCSDSSITLALSHDTKTDEFDSLMRALSHNESVSPSTGEGTGPQVIRLSHAEQRDASKNPLIADAEARRKEMGLA